MPFTLNFQAGTGTMTVTAGSIVVNGSGTAFSTQLLPGMPINVGGQNRVIDTINSATTLTVTQAFTSAATGASFTFAPTVTQSGTDTSLATLRALSLINTINANRRRICDLRGLRLIVTGTLTINGYLEALNFRGTSGAVNDLRIESGGRLILSAFADQSGERFYWDSTILQFDRLAPDTFSQGGAAINVLSGGTYEHRGGTVQSEPVVWFSSGSTAIFEEATILGNSATQIVCGATATLTFDGRLIAKGNMRLSLGSGTFIGLSPQGNPSRAMEGVANATRTMIDYQGRANAAELNLRDDVRVDFVNSARGTGYTIIAAFAGAAPNTLNGGIAQFLRTVQPTVTDLAGVGLNAAVFCRDSDSGNRQNLPDFPAANFLADRTYTWSVTDGSTVAQDVLQGVYTLPSNGAGDSLRLDRRGIGATSADTFRFDVWAYIGLTQSRTLSTVGIGTLALPFQLLPDTNITLSEAAAGAVAGLTTLDDLYDLAKHWKTRPMAARLEYPSRDTQPVTGSGSVLDLGSRNLVVDASATPAFDINIATDTITVKSTTLAAGAKFQSITTTGTITTANGATISASVTDASGSRVSITRDGGGDFTARLMVNGVPQATAFGVTSLPLTVQPTDTIRIAMMAFGTKPRVINTTGAALMASASFALAPDSAVDTTVPQATLDALALAVDSAVQGDGSIAMLINTDLSGYTPAQALAGIQYWLTTQAASYFGALLATNSADIVVLSRGRVTINTTAFFTQPADTWGVSQTVPDLGVRVPLVIVSPVLGARPARPNASGVVLCTAQWTQQEAEVNAAPIATATRTLIRPDLIIINENTKTAGAGIPGDLDIGA